ncbi:acyl-CoA dehydrogenase family protein [Streptomyces sp. 24-1644]|uniref:acyl-CoA dehydrogenase family protein n=1 Tax=Streptomyces sp. 24-1644 TaxID=3457315 RepID=UPI003FA6D31A
MGFYGIHLPAEHDGQDLSYAARAALKEEIGASGRVLGHSVLGDMGGPLRAGDILQYATEQQLRKYLLPLIRGERACCFSLTETDAGSDVRSMRTTAARDGEGYRLTGHKVFNSAGPFADFAIVVARMAGTGEAEGDKALPFMAVEDPLDAGLVQGDNDVFETADGRLLSLATFEDKFGHRFRTELADDFPALDNPAYDRRAHRTAAKQEVRDLLCESSGPATTSGGSSGSPPSTHRGHP